MKTFKQFLGESAFQQKITVEEAVALAKKHCKDALRFPETPIVRGMKYNGCHIMQGDLGSRKSRSTSNFYTTIFDETLPPLGYPKRSASAICATNGNSHHASRYGNLFAILPFNGVPIGVCPELDMWDTMVKIGKREDVVSDWNDYFGETLEAPDTTFDALVKHIEALLRNPEEDHDSDAAKKYFKKGQVEKQLHNAYSADAAGMALTTSKDPAIFHEDAMRELWIGGKCIAMPIKEYMKHFGAVVTI